MLKIVMLIYFIASILTSFYVRVERRKKTKVTPELKEKFFDVPESFEEKFSVKSFNKYLLELVLFFFLISLVLAINIFFTDLFIKSASSFGEIELYGLICFMQFMFVILSGYVICSLQESIALFKKYINLNKFEVMVGKNGIYFPFFIFEGTWREIAQDCYKNFLYVQYFEIQEFVVEPSRGMRRVSPPYFKIKINFHDEYIYVQRSAFARLEKDFVNSIQSKLPIQITFNDSLR